MILPKRRYVNEACAHLRADKRPITLQVPPAPKKPVQSSNLYHVHLPMPQFSRFRAETFSDLPSTHNDSGSRGKALFAESMEDGEEAFYQNTHPAPKDPKVVGLFHGGGKKAWRVVPTTKTMPLEVGGLPVHILPEVGPRGVVAINDVLAHLGIVVATNRFLGGSWLGRQVSVPDWRFLTRVPSFLNFRSLAGGSWLL